MQKQKNIALVCPACRQELIQRDSTWRCNSCAKKYPIKEGVVCFLDETDEFYEGTYNGTVNITFSSPKSFKEILSFYFYKDFYLNAIRKYAKTQTGLILDIGCAGGIKYLAQKGNVVGLIYH